MTSSDSSAIHPADDRFRAYLGNQLDSVQDASIQAHLADCLGCRNRLERLQEDHSEPRAAPPPLWIARRLRSLVSGRFVPGAMAPVIDGYSIETLIGRGGMGVVYRAHHADFGTVALKTIQDDGHVDAVRLDRFRREMAQARTMSALATTDDGGRRVAAVRVFEVNECRGTLYISMEWAAGGTIRDRLTELIERPTESARLLLPVAEALEELHRQGAVHRDIKPANLLLQIRPGDHQQPGDPPSLDSLDAILSDFGLARGSTSSGPAHTEPHDLPGTLPYIAPELIRDGRSASPRSDVYSLGATLYEMLSGAPPFGDKGISRKTLLDRISAGHPSRPSDQLETVPRPLETIAMKCLERDPARRYASAQDVADDLRRFLNREPIRARPPGPLRRTARWAGKHKGLVTTGFVALVSILAAIGLVWGANRDRELATFRAQTLLYRAHEELVRTARAEAGSGRWSVALPRYAEAIRDGWPDAISLRVERLHGLLAENATEELDAELASLGTEEDLGTLRAQVQLIQGARWLSDIRRTDEARRLIRESLQHRADLNFSRGDAEFAEALLETRPMAAIDHLTRALDLDPLHRQAHASITVALASAGRIEEARNHNDELRRLFPGAVPTSRLAALIDTIDRNRDESNPSDGAEERGIPENVRAYLTPLADALKVFDHFQALAPLRPEDAAQLDDSIARLKSESARSVAFSVPTITLFDQWMSRMLEARRWNEPTDENLRKLLALAEENPESLLLAMATGNRFHHFVMSFMRGDIASARKHALEASRLGLLAAEAPTVIPRSPIRYQSRIVSAVADLSILKLTPEPAPVHLTRLREQFPNLVTDGSNWPAIRDQGLGMLVELLVVPLTADQARDWQVNTPEGLAAFESRRRKLLRYADTLTDHWIEETAGSPAAFNARGVLDRQGSHNGLQPIADSGNGSARD